MSEMLEQAIIDADALKEAALKNAENAILEKYSGEIKTALDKLLEQPLVPGTPEEDPLAAEGDPLDLADDELGADPLAIDTEVEDLEEDTLPDLKMAHTDSTDMCIDGCPDEEQMVEIDLDKLAEALNLDREDEEESIIDISNVSQLEEEKDEESIDEAGRPQSMRAGRTMADLDKEAKTRETDFLKKKDEDEVDKVEESSAPVKNWWDESLYTKLVKKYTDTRSK